MGENLTRLESVNDDLTIRDLFLIIRRHIIAVLSIILAFVLAGVAYVFVLKPEYSVTQKLAYKCDNSAISSMGTVVSNYNTMIAYGDTIIDLFDEGVVLDRANYYYNEYLNRKSIGQQEADNYVAELVKRVNNQEKDLSYTPPKNAQEQLSHIEKSHIKTDALSTLNESKFIFSVTYTDENEREAEEKLSFLVYAFALECCETMEVDGEWKSKYFGEFKVIISDLGLEGVSDGGSKLKYLLLFSLAGVAVAIIAACVLDGVKTKKNIVKEATGDDGQTTKEERGE